jgi:hypothetical protein
VRQSAATGKRKKFTTPRKKATKKATKKQAGRPSKFTKERIAKFLDLISQGNFKTVAAKACGFTAETLSQWEKAKPGFSEQIKVAESESETNLVKVIRDTTGTQWTAAAWLLERKSYERWGKKEKREISGHLLNGTPEQTEQAVIDLYRENPELWKRIKERVENV